MIRRKNIFCDNFTQTFEIKLPNFQSRKLVIAYIDHCHYFIYCEQHVYVQNWRKFDKKTDSKRFLYFIIFYSSFHPRVFVINKPSTKHTRISFFFHWQTIIAHMCIYINNDNEAFWNNVKSLFIPQHCYQCLFFAINFFQLLRFVLFNFECCDN